MEKPIKVLYFSYATLKFVDDIDWLVVCFWLSTASNWGTLIAVSYYLLHLWTAVWPNWATYRQLGIFWSPWPKMPKPILAVKLVHFSNEICFGNFWKLAINGNCSLGQLAVRFLPSKVRGLSLEFSLQQLQEHCLWMRWKYENKETEWLLRFGNILSVLWQFFALLNGETLKIIN